MRYEMEPETSCSFFHKKTFGFIKSFLPSPIQAGLDVVGSLVGGGGGDARARKAARAQELNIAAANRAASAADVSRGLFTISRRSGVGRTGSGCPDGWIPRNGNCTRATGSEGVSRELVQLPDIDPLVVSPAERSISRGQAVAGAFGMPAMVPEVEMRRRLSCPSGMVLGEDELCYPKQVLRRDSRFRKWKPGVRPILTGGQRNSIRKARSAITAAKEAVSGLGVTVKK